MEKVEQFAGENFVIYRDDLAYIHVDGYGFHWAGAAEAILAWFNGFGITGGMVVDLGCGGGQWLARLADHGYETYGIDVSASMIRLAKRGTRALGVATIRPLRIAVASSPSESP